MTGTFSSKRNSEMLLYLLCVGGNKIVLAPDFGEENVNAERLIGLVLDELDLFEQISRLHLC